MKVRGETLNYTAGGVEMNGYLAFDEALEGPRPGVLVVHEWWGCNAYARKRADMLAALGYTALAVDMYGHGKTADNPDQAGQLMTGVLEDMASGRARFTAALEALQGQASVDETRVAAIGYCFGGGVVVHMARAGAPLAAVASFHGSLGLAKAPGPDTIKARVVAYNGEADSLVSADDLATFKAEMEAVGARWQLVQLPGALHGFSNPQATVNGEKYGLPLGHDELADQASWAHMQLVLREAFAGA
jgi:dienelactone hydrolase